LNLNYLNLSDLDVRQGGLALRDLLRLYVGSNDNDQLLQIEGVIGSEVAPVTRRLSGGGPLVYGRGVNVKLMVDEDHFSGSSPYLLGLILERYIARHTSINVFTETELHSMQRGVVARWAVRSGNRGMV
jgi:type VI secretion system protein ImpG